MGSWSDSSGDGDAPPMPEPEPEPEPVPKPTDYPNVLEERQNVPLSQVNAQLNDAFLQLFFGDPDTEAIFFDQGDGTGYIEDIANGDVRTDSMGYGMIVTVQLNQREVYDKLWSWAKTHMMVDSGPARGLLSWNCDTAGSNCTNVAATDASSMIATSLFMAQSRWGSAGAHDYGGDAVTLLDVMVDVEGRNGGVVDGVYNCFDASVVLPRNDSANAEAEVYTDYLMPAFYEIWAERDPERVAFWLEMADNSRELLRGIADSATGLLPAVVTYQGTLNPDNDNYRTTTHRALLNMTLDHMWNGPTTWVVEQNERRLDFFLSEGVDTFVTEYSLAGDPITNFSAIEHLSLVALSAGTSTNPDHDVFIEALLDLPIPTGNYRYFDGMLYMLSLLALSGQMTPD